MVKIRLKKDRILINYYRWHGLNTVIPAMRVPDLMEVWAGI